MKATIRGALCASAFILSTNCNAALIERLGGLAYYDDVADLTWLADANYAQTSGYDADGVMSWESANTWVAGLIVDGVDGWRLPDTLQPDANCGSQSRGFDYGYNCTGSEMGNLFYNVLGNTADSLTNTGPFSNIQEFGYWSATDETYRIGDAWYFSMNSGKQNYFSKSINYNAWAVRSGDISAVPVPAAVWLFGSGLLGLVGLARRKPAIPCPTLP